MDKVDYYYNKLLSIVNLKYSGIKTLSKHDFDMKEIIDQIIRAGNEFILDDVYLYSFVCKAIEYDDFKKELKDSLVVFTTNNKDILINLVRDLYTDIFYFNEIDIFHHNLHKLKDYIDNGNIPLLNELKELTHTVDNKVYVSDYFVLREIFLIILGYCIIYNEEDNYLEYCYDYCDYPNMIIEDLLLNGIIIETNDNNYGINTYELKKYIISRIKRTKRKLLK